MQRGSGGCRKSDRKKGKKETYLRKYRGNGWKTKGIRNLLCSRKRGKCNFIRTRDVDTAPRATEGNRDRTSPESAAVFFWDIDSKTVKFISAQSM
jgi:hypothetical protein